MAVYVVSGETASTKVTIGEMAFVSESGDTEPHTPEVEDGIREKRAGLLRRTGRCMARLALSAAANLSEGLQAIHMDAGRLVVCIDFICILCYHANCKEVKQT